MSKTERDFWSFSVDVYADVDVQGECLNLQDRHGVDVNVLLFCAFVGAVQRAVVPKSDIKEALLVVAGWNENVVSALRKARRGLKPFAAAQTSIGRSAAVLRNAVKASELEAERIEHSMLESWGREHIWRRAEAGTAIKANVTGILAICCESAPPPQMPDRLIAVAIAAAGPP